MATYSLRAECLVDIANFIKELCNTDLCVEQVTIATESYIANDTVLPLPEAKMQFVSAASLTELRDVIRTVTDGHVMLQTLRALPLSENKLERDYDLE
jgi:hypothetical protein